MGKITSLFLKRRKPLAPATGRPVSPINMPLRGRKLQDRYGFQRTEQALWQKQTQGRYVLTTDEQMFLDTMHSLRKFESDIKVMQNSKCADPEFLNEKKQLRLDVINELLDLKKRLFM